MIGLDQMYILIELGGVANIASHSPSGYTIQIDMRTHCSIRTTLSVEASKWKCVVEIESYKKNELNFAVWLLPLLSFLYNGRTKRTRSKIEQEKIRAKQSLESFDNFAHAMQSLQTKSAIHVSGGLDDGARSVFDDE